MKKWFEEFLNKVRFNKTTKTEPQDLYVQNIARDKYGRWVVDNLGNLVYKSDTSERIAKFTKLQEEKQEESLKTFQVTVSEGCGNCDECLCSSKKEDKPAPKPKPMPKPTVNKKVEEVKAEAKRQQEKYGTTKPVAKKKPTGGGTKKERPAE